MISDTLFQAVLEIDTYLQDKDNLKYESCGEFAEIKLVRFAMNRLREKLDNPDYKMSEDYKLSCAEAVLFIDTDAALKLKDVREITKECFEAAEVE